MGRLIPKLYQLLEKECKLQADVKERISSLTQELEFAQAALRKVGEVPWDQLDEQVKIWARHVREASYDMEDVLDTFLVRVQQAGPDDSTEQEESLLKQRLKKMAKLVKKIKPRHKISGDVDDIMTQLQEVTERCRRYKVVDIVARPASTGSTVDPRLHAMYSKAKDLVGIENSSGDLISMLQPPQQGDDASNMKMKIVSVVGVGGLGKTTLAKAVYDKLITRGDFNYGAFVPVGRNPDLKKIFKDILIDLDRQRYLQFGTAVLDERQLIDELRNFLREDKRFFIVIDDIWETDSWEKIKLVFNDDNNCGGRIIITTRNLEVARKADKKYKLQPLPYDSSRDLLYSRISGGHERGYVDNQPDDLTNEILNKCDGIPLAIITMASLLAGKPRAEWPRLYKSIGFWFKDTKQAENTMKILSYSYYDLPSHLKTCLLYLSAFPEDSFIPKESLVWMWAAEGFVCEEDRISLFEIGEKYFNDLINRSMIQPVESEDKHCMIVGCRVHDMVLDFIRAMSCEENFFTVLDTSNHGTPIQSSARRLANHHRTIELSRLVNQSDMKKVRSFIALDCVIETWAPFSSFTLLRVLAIEDLNLGDDGLPVQQVEHIGHLLHLRFLSLRGTSIVTFPEKEIGALKFLQTLDLWGCDISEFPSRSCFPKRLVCLRISFDSHTISDDNMFSVEGMTSLQELTIQVSSDWYKSTWPAVEGLGLGCLRELRVLVLNSAYCNLEDDKVRRYLVASLRHLNKLQRLTIDVFSKYYHPKWLGRELVLPHQIQHLFISSLLFKKLPSCINPSCLPNLSHLDLYVQALDEQDLKLLGGFPELHFLRLELPKSLFSSPPSSATISNINDSDACYFPKLRHCRLERSMVLFVPNNKVADKSISFHIWSGNDDIAMPMPSPDDGDTDELKSEDESQQSPMPSVSAGSDEKMNRDLQRQHGFAALLAYYFSYLLAFLHCFLEFIKKWSVYQVWQHRSISHRGSTPIIGPSVSDNGEKEGHNCSNNSSAAQPRFMPRLEVLEFQVPRDASYICCEYLGWDYYLHSLREISADVMWHGTDKKMEEALRRAAQVHPNRPTLR